MSKKLTGKLTAKQEQFCQEYMVDFNATQACIRAGYSEKTSNEQGSRLLANVKISTRVLELQQELRLSTKKTREDIIQDLTDVVDEFKMTGVFTAHTLKAIEILNKMLGWNEPDKVDIEHKGIIINMVQPKPRDNNGDGD